MWAVGGRATKVHDGYLVFPVVIRPDWEHFNQQMEETGGNPDLGVSPVASLSITFVSAGGRTYDDMPNYSRVPGGVPDDDWYGLGDVYPPAEKIEARYFVTVPADEVEGGVWRISNTANEAVFVAQK